MDIETRRLLILALQYTETSLDDMKWHRRITDLDGINSVTNGTPCFDTEEEFEKYMSAKQDYVNELKGLLNLSDEWALAEELKNIALRKKVENMASSFSLEEARKAWIETQMEVFEMDSSVKERWLEEIVK